MFNNFTFKGAAKRLENIDIPRIGSKIGVGEDEIHAFMDVEAAGSGFDKQGRPKMLRETHKFWRNLGPGKARDKAASLGLATPKWVRNYPADSYTDLARMIDIGGVEIAIMSCSWALGQIMGENAKLIGYASATDMVTAFMEDEETHLEAIIQFLIATGIDDDLRAHRWQVVARVYNGEGYAVNQYDLKLSRAFAKWARIPDTPWEGTLTLPDTQQQLMLRTLRRGDTGEDVKILQHALDITADGVFGSRTEGAVKTFQLRSKLAADGIVGKKTWGALGLLH